MKLFAILMIALFAAPFCRSEDFRNKPFTIQGLESWLGCGVSIADIKSAFGGTPMVLGSLEETEENEDEDEEFFASSERYIYPIQEVAPGLFQRAEAWSMGCPTISFRFSGTDFLEAFILNPDAQHLIKLRPQKNKANK